MVELGGERTVRNLGRSERSMSGESGDGSRMMLMIVRNRRLRPDVMGSRLRHCSASRTRFSDKVSEGSESLLDCNTSLLLVNHQRCSGTRTVRKHQQQNVLYAKCAITMVILCPEIIITTASLPVTGSSREVFVRTAPGTLSMTHSVAQVQLVMQAAPPHPSTALARRASFDRPAMCGTCIRFQARAGETAELHSVLLDIGTPARKQLGLAGENSCSALQDAHTCLTGYPHKPTTTKSLPS